MAGLLENDFINTKNSSYTIEADGSANGVILAQGGRFGGYSLYVKDGTPMQTEPNVYSADETAGVGVDMETPVSDDHTRSNNEFTGKIHKVTIALKDESN